MPEDLAAQIAALDVSLLGSIESQTSERDRRSLLALHEACRQAYGSFEWLEIGSHLGGSLQALVRDPACTRIVSIDPRPDSQPDERGMDFPYEDNSTQRMLDLLAALPDADTAKIEPIEAGTDTLAPSAIPGSPQFCFVDGEHTVTAALRDARFCRKVIGDVGCIAFHDAWIVHAGIRAFLEELRADGVEARPYLMPDAVFVVELGGVRLLDAPQVTACVLDNSWGYLHALRAWDGTADAKRLKARVGRRVRKLSGGRI